MTAQSMKAPQPIQLRMIAPCGMDCALCIAHLRAKRRCPGCTGRRDDEKPPHCVSCAIKTCVVSGRPRKFCFECSSFPCRRMRQLDLRYRTKYGMSMIENLEFIRASGIRKFVAREKVRWACPQCGQSLCVHRGACLRCGQPRPPIIPETARRDPDGSTAGIPRTARDVPAGVRSASRKTVPSPPRKTRRAWWRHRR
jgi:hypothetical protein